MSVRLPQSLRIGSRPIPTMLLLALAFAASPAAPSRVAGSIAEPDSLLPLTDRVPPPGVSVRAFNHLLGACGVTLFATPKLVSKYRRGFPRALDGAPFLLPSQTSTLRRAIEQWFEKQRIRPHIIGEFDDSTLIEVFGQAGKGIFATPSIVETSVCSQYGVKIVGHLDRVRERFYAISAERRLEHPGVIAITESARRELFG